MILLKDIYSTSNNMKSKADRTKESVHILRQLKEIGIMETSLGYIEMKKAFDTWIDNGPSWKGKIRFPECNRMADVILPVNDKAFVSVKLRVI